MDPVILGRSIPIFVLGSVGLVWSLVLLIRKRPHIFQNLLLLLTSVGLCYSHAAVILVSSSDFTTLVSGNLLLVAIFFSYIQISLLWCVAIDVFRTSAPAPETQSKSLYGRDLIATYFGYFYTLVMVAIAIAYVVYGSFDETSYISMAVTSCFLTFGQWLFPILFLIQYHRATSKKSVSTFSTSLWLFFGILTLFTILITVTRALELAIENELPITHTVDVYTLFDTISWIDWISNSILASIAVLYMCFTGPKWVVSRKRHIRLSWSEQFDEPENGLVGRGSVSRLRSTYGGRYDESEDLYASKIEVENTEKKLVGT